MTKKQMKQVIFMGVGCVILLIAGIIYSLLFNDARWVKNMDIPERTTSMISCPFTDIFCIQSHDFFKICDITSTAYLPHTGNSWFDGDSGSVMQFIF